MTPDMIRDLATKTLDDMKGTEITTLDVHSLTDIADYMIICTARSSRQARAMAETCVMKAKAEKISPARSEEGDGEWILVDLGAVIVHIMLAQARQFYDLESLWEPIEALRARHEDSDLKHLK